MITRLRPYKMATGPRGATTLASGIKHMKDTQFSLVKLVISFIISGSIIFAGTSLIRYLDPTFSVGLFDLLRQPYPTAWLLLAVLAGMIYAALSFLPVFSSVAKNGRRKKGDEGA